MIFRSPQFKQLIDRNLIRLTNSVAIKKLSVLKLLLFSYHFLLLLLLLLSARAVVRFNP